MQDELIDSAYTLLDSSITYCMVSAMILISICMKAHNGCVLSLLEIFEVLSAQEEGSHI